MSPLADELHTVEEKEEEAYVEFEIATYPSDYTLEILSAMVAKGEITVPDYQRKYVWTIQQASKLIESFLMGLPVPQIFLYVNEESIFEVIDGQQRLRSVAYFLSGYYGDPDAQGRQKIFKLTGLSEKSPYKNKSFSNLEERVQRKLKSQVLRAINIKQLSPSGESTSVYHIFERLNTGGTLLKPQEIRNAVFRGKIVSALQSLNMTEGWLTILGLKEPERTQKDVELVLRLFSLFRVWRAYEKPMKEYLNRQMKSNRSFSSDNAREFSERFPKAVALVRMALGDRPFRPKRVVNAAVLEAVMIALLENPEIDVNRLRVNYPKLFADQDFLKGTTGATTDTKILYDRIERASAILAA